MNDLGNIKKSVCDFVTRYCLRIFSNQNYLHSYMCEKRQNKAYFKHFLWCLQSLSFKYSKSEFSLYKVQQPEIDEKGQLMAVLSVGK